MRIFLDTNVLLDIILKREPNYTSAAQVCEIALREGDTLVISNLSIKKDFAHSNIAARIYQQFNSSTIQQFN